MEQQVEIARAINEEIARRVELAIASQPGSEEGAGPTMAGYLEAYSFGGQPAGPSNGQGAVTPFGRIEEPGSGRVPPLVFFGGDYINVIFTATDSRSVSKYGDRQQAIMK